MIVFEAACLGWKCGSLVESSCLAHIRYLTTCPALKEENKQTKNYPLYYNDAIFFLLAFDYDDFYHIKH